jgi:hypothetical protein
MAAKASIKESIWLRTLAGILMLVSAFGVGLLFIYLAFALADSFPPRKSFGQNAALFALFFTGFGFTVMVGVLGITMILRRKP